MGEVVAPSEADDFRRRNSLEEGEVSGDSIGKNLRLEQGTLKMGLLDSWEERGS